MQQVIIFLGGSMRERAREVVSSRQFKLATVAALRAAVPDCRPLDEKIISDLIYVAVVVAFFLQGTEREKFFKQAFCYMTVIAGLEGINLGLLGPLHVDALCNTHVFNFPPDVHKIGLNFSWVFYPAVGPVLFFFVDFAKNLEQQSVRLTGVVKYLDSAMKSGLIVALGFCLLFLVNFEKRFANQARPQVLDPASMDADLVWVLRLLSCGMQDRRGLGMPSGHSSRTALFGALGLESLLNIDRSTKGYIKLALIAMLVMLQVMEFIVTPWARWLDEAHSGGQVLQGFLGGVGAFIVVRAFQSDIGEDYILSKARDILCPCARRLPVDSELVGVSLQGADFAQGAAAVV